MLQQRKAEEPAGLLITKYAALKQSKAPLLPPSPDFYNYFILDNLTLKGKRSPYLKKKKKKLQTCIVDLWGIIVEIIILDISKQIKLISQPFQQ